MAKNNKKAKTIINPRQLDIKIGTHPGHLIDDELRDAFNNIANGGTITILEGEHLIHDEFILSNKTGITINCIGSLKLNDNARGVVGTIKFKGSNDITVNNLKFDGNSDNNAPSGQHGKRSLIEIDNCDTVTFNNLTMTNVVECGINSNVGLRNITFNKVHFENVGEHCIYWGGNGVVNCTINKVYCKNIGLATVNHGRSVAFLKMRNKNSGESLHENITIRGFEFISETNRTNVDRQLVQAFDAKNVKILSGKIKGDDTSIFATNLRLEEMEVNNVHLEGRRVCFDISKYHGWDGTTKTEIAENEKGKMDIVIKNSNLTGYNENFTEIRKYHNCNIDLKDKQYNDSRGFDTHDKVEFNACNINIRNYRLSLSKSTKCDIEFNDVNFIGYPVGHTQPIVFNQSLSDGKTISFNNVKAETDLGLLINTTTPINLDIKDSVINAGVRSQNVKYKNINIENSRLKTYNISNNATFDNLVVDKIYDMDGDRKDYSNYTFMISANQKSANVTISDKCIENLGEEDIVVISDNTADFTYTFNQTTLNVTLAKEQQIDTTFTIIYKREV